MKKFMIIAILPIALLFSSCGGGKGNQIDELWMPVTIDYSKSIDELIAEGFYDYVNSDISISNFTAKDGDDKIDTIIERTAILINFNRRMSSEDIIAQMALRGLRPATARELLKLGARYPKLQREISVIALGSKSPTSGVLALWENAFGSRNANLWHWSDGWSSSYWFLAFRD
jgi:hypothetical protein